MGITGYKKKHKHRGKDHWKGYRTNKLVKETWKNVRKKFNHINNMIGKTQKGDGNNI